MDVVLDVVVVLLEVDVVLDVLVLVVVEVLVLAEVDVLVVAVVVMVVVGVVVSVVVGVNVVVSSKLSRMAHTLSLPSPQTCPPSKHPALPTTHTLPALARATNRCASPALPKSHSATIDPARTRACRHVATKQACVGVHTHTGTWASWSADTAIVARLQMCDLRVLLA